MLHVPILRAGRPYRSLDRVRLSHVGTREGMAEVSQANAGLIARDLGERGRRRRVLERVPVQDVLEICRRAAPLFAEARLPLDAEACTTQSPDEFIACQSATTGLPRTLCRANLEKIRFVLAEMEPVLAGLTRGVDLAVLDSGRIEQEGRTLSYVGAADALGAVLPSNSPGVHALWLPAVALKIPLVLKPGREEPWTPLRVAQALIAAGCPGEAFSFYPTDYSGATEILLRCERSMLYGGESTVAAWADDRRVQLHGPGWSKVLFGDDRVDDWRAHLDVLVRSVADNAGRSCINASGVWVPRHADEIAAALADRLAGIEARPLDAADAALAAFPSPAAARAISAHLDRQLAIPGAEEITVRPGGRVAEVGGCTFLLPTVVRCAPDHPLAAAEYLFPFVAVVECPQSEMTERIGPTLVATAITDEPEFRRELMLSRSIDRLNLGPRPTSRVSWDQPHEGNLFEHLYRQRAFDDRSSSAGAAA